MVDRVWKGISFENHKYFVKQIIYSYFWNCKYKKININLPDAKLTVKAMGPFSTYKKTTSNQQKNI